MEQRGAIGCLLLIAGVVGLVVAVRRGWPKWVIVIICIYMGFALITLAGMAGMIARTCVACGRKMTVLSDATDPYSGGVESARQCTSCGKTYCRRCALTGGRCGCGAADFRMIKVRYLT